MHRALTIATLLACSSCTVGLPLTAAGVTGIHNHYVDHAEDKWSYPAPVLTCVVVGALIDYAILKKLGAGFARLARQ